MAAEPRRRTLAALVSFGLALGLPAQAPGRAADRAGKLPTVDPYTRGEAEAMASLGVVGYGPMPWADGKSTAAVDAVLGEGRIVWLETAHYRLGCALAPAAMPEEAKVKKALLEDCAALHKKLARVPERPKRLETWLWAHVYALRLERHYAAVSALLGVSDADFPRRGPGLGEGPYLGMPDKYLVLLFQKQSDLTRYADRFCGAREDTSMRHFHQGSNQLLTACATEGLEGYDDNSVHGHVLYMATNNLLCGLRGYLYPLPLWLSEGIAHWLSRQVDSDTVNVQILDSEAVAEDKQANWPVKVRRRAQFEELCIPFATMAAWQDFATMGYHAHAQAWSRVDYLIQRDRAAFAGLVGALKSLPPGEGGAAPAELVRETGRQLGSRFGLDAAAFDREWREWVLRTYPKK